MLKLHQLFAGYDFSTLENSNLEEIRKQINENSKRLEESIKELEEANFRVSNSVK